MDLVSHSYAELFPQKALSFLTNFLQDQLILSEHTYVAVWDKFTQQGTKMSKMEIVVFLRKKFKFVKVSPTETTSLPFLYWHRRNPEASPQRKHHGMNTFYMEHNFSQNEPGREV